MFAYTLWGRKEEERKRQEGKRKKEMEDHHDSMSDSYLEVKFKQSILIFMKLSRRRLILILSDMIYK